MINRTTGISCQASQIKLFFWVAVCCFSYSTLMGQHVIPFKHTPLVDSVDFAPLIVQSADHFLTQTHARVIATRENHWQRDFDSAETFDRSTNSQRVRLKDMLGVIDNRQEVSMQALADPDFSPYQIESATLTVKAVRWNVIEGLSAEGLLLIPKSEVKARVVLLPDADIQPEVFAGMTGRDKAGYGIGWQLARMGCEVIIPTLVDRTAEFSGNASLGMFTNQPHREWIYRQAYEVGRHVIGYELQKIFAALDWMEQRGGNDKKSIPLGVAGYGEGGLLALYAAALDNRITSTLVSGYFDSRETLWREPIYRNVYGFSNDFGDAELSVMAWPRNTVIEHSRAPEISGPPVPSKGGGGAAPGRLTTPMYNVAKAEFDKAIALLPVDRCHLHWFADNHEPFGNPFSADALGKFMAGLGHPQRLRSKQVDFPESSQRWIAPKDRQHRTVKEMETLVQRVLALCERSRQRDFWAALSNSDTAEHFNIKNGLRDRFWNQIGRLPAPTVPANPRARVLETTAAWTSYEVVLDVWEGLPAWGILVVPNKINATEKRPVVVCQHGLEGLPAVTLNRDPQAEDFKIYKAFAAQLAERGYVTFAPFNLYRGGDRFRVLQRKGNPIGYTLFSMIIGQHQRILEWLGLLPFVDAKRIGFYGLSYGGKSAMRIPAVLTGYALSICSADFNEWVRKCASTDMRESYMFSSEYDMPEWNLGHTFNYAEMAGLIAPRPFMVERGHFDGVAVDEWVGYEYGKVRRHYNLIGIPEKTQIEFFVGPHAINGVGTFEFLDKHLKNNPTIQ